MSQINVRDLCNENEDGAPTIVGVSTFSATSYMCPPKGTTAQRPENPVSGSLRFNTDTASLEYYKGDTLNWTQIEMTSPDLDGGARGMFAGGQTPSLTDRVDYITIATFGDAIDFGNLQAGKQRMGVTSDSTRLVTGGGFTTHFSHMEEEYEKAGYDFPKIVFWNLDAHFGTPAKCSDDSVAMVSGFSPSIMKAVLNAEEFNPISVMMEALKDIELDYTNLPEDFSYVLEN